MTESIRILSPLQQMYMRAGMYIGDSKDPETLYKELNDNFIDELLCGYASRCEIDYDFKAGWYRVRDNGRGLPLGLFKTENPDMIALNGAVSARLLFCQSFSSGKYDKSNYKYSAGTNGIGIKACNVFSTKTFVRVKDVKNIHDGKYYYLTLGWSDPDRDQIVEEDWIDPSDIKEDKWWSTEITIWPDDKIFRGFSAKIKEVQLRLAKSLRPDVKIAINGKEVSEFSFKDYVDDELINDIVFETKVEYGTVKYDIMFAWSTKEVNKSIMRGAVNMGQCNDGYHLKETRNAIGRALCAIDSTLSVEDVDFGLRLFVSALVAEPQYSGQTKEKLTWLSDFDVSNKALTKEHYLTILPDDSTATSADKDAANKEAKLKANNDKRWLNPTIFYDKITDAAYKILNENDDYTAHLISRIIAIKKSLDMLNEQNYIDSMIKTGNDKITRQAVKGIKEATSSNRSECELYICEGKSAGSPINQHRDRATQALLELRGKPFNAVNFDKVEDILGNQEIKTLINGIGIGMLRNTKPEYARYGKLIIATDGDPDGLHIQGLLLGILAYLVPQVYEQYDTEGNVIKESMVYIAHAPLYSQNGKFIYNDEDLDMNKKFDRFKGLGSMEDQDLATAIVKVKTRKLKHISIKDARAKILDIVTLASEKKRIMLDSGSLEETIF